MMEQNSVSELSNRSQLSISGLKQLLGNTNVKNVSLGHNQMFTNTETCPLSNIKNAKCIDSKNFRMSSKLFYLYKYLKCFK